MSVLRKASCFVTIALVAAKCPFIGSDKSKEFLPNPHVRRLAAEPPHTGRQLQATLGYDVNAVKTAIANMLPNSAADFGSYGGFLIRLAWHCAGTYRAKDGRGGCDGARIRLDIEKNWADNAGLDEALSLLNPIQTQFGSALSWGDLIVLAGSTAIERMGGPNISFCGGRVDTNDVSESLLLQPNNDASREQLIYVNAGDTNATDIRNTFAAMDFANDTELIALVAGGHTFGKCHKSRSGFEGPWTSTPTQWSSEYISNLLSVTYTAGKNPSGSGNQFNNSDNTLMMLVADMAFKADASYLAALNTYNADNELLKKDFGKAWEKLMNRDLGNKPCAGQWPPAPVWTVNYTAVKADVAAILGNDTRSTDFKNYGPLFVRFAWHCAGTYRSTDNRGGCNGARILHAPEKSWGSNPGLVEFKTVTDHPSDDVLALNLLQPIKDRYGAGLSWADLIIIAGSTSIESLSGNKITIDVCAGRTDDADGSGSAYLEEEIYLDASRATAEQIKESMYIMGFNASEMTVLNGGGHAIGKAHWHKSGFEGPWTKTPTVFDNSFFTTLLNNEWSETTSNKGGKRQFKDAAGELMMLSTDMAFKTDSEFGPFVTEYAADNSKFLVDFKAAWEKLINSDRFGNACDGKIGSTSPASGDDFMSDGSKISPLELFYATLIAAVILFTFN